MSPRSPLIEGRGISRMSKELMSPPIMRVPGEQSVSSVGTISLDRNQEADEEEGLTGKHNSPHNGALIRIQPIENNSQFSRQLDSVESRQESLKDRSAFNSEGQIGAPSISLGRVVQV